MRSHCAIYIDAGYLLAAAATTLTGTSYRSGIQVNHELLLGHLADIAEKRSQLPLLRTYWYDAARDGRPDSVLEQIGLLPRVKVRLGRMSGGEQKGVDLRIGLDMVTHARNGAVEVMYLVSGDDDLTEAVEESQTHGVQVVILAVPTSTGAAQSVSLNLQRAADAVDLIGLDEMRTAVKATASGAVAAIAAASTTKPMSPPVPAPPGNYTATRPSSHAQPQAVYSSTTGGGSTISPEYARTSEEAGQIATAVAERVLAAWLAGASEEDRNNLLASRPSVPSEVDRTLLRDASAELGVYDLADVTRYQLRAAFWKAVDAWRGGVGVRTT